MSPSGTRGWVRYGGIAGFVAFAATLAANLAIIIFRPADLCRVGPVSVILLDLGALLALLLLAATAGFATGRSVGSVSQAALAGVLVGVIAGAALPALLLSRRWSPIGCKNSTHSVRKAPPLIAAGRSRSASARHHLRAL